MVCKGESSSRRLVAIVAIATAVTLVGCAQTASDSTNAEIAAVDEASLPEVVATSSILCDLTQQIAADTIHLTCLLDPGQDPHTYQAQPSDRQAIDDADLVLYGGYNFSPGIERLLAAGSSAVPRVAVFEAAVTNPLMGKGHDHDHAEGDAHAHDEAAAHDHDAAADAAEHDHPAEEAHDAEHDHGNTEELVADPHVWHSASNNAAIVEVIASNLAEVNPDQAAVYEENAAQLAAQFTALEDWIQAQVDTIPAGSRKLVTTHDSFRYFADAYGLEVKGALSGLSTEEKPSAGSLTALVDQVKGAAVPAIFAETTTNPELINSVARDAGVKVAEQPLYVAGPGGPGTNAETTQEMLVSNTCTIVNALGGTCAEADAPM
jgi:manganese/iron transport system substrate-binding protein